jgi:tetratricopeptide (TPR) repeat protein
MAGGDRAGADHHIAAHASFAAEQGRTVDRRDAAALATMVALLDGREAEARSGSDAVLALGREAHDSEAADRYWAQRLWVLLEWGREDEHGELLDHCRQRAYRDDDTAWMGTVSLLLARSGGLDEARAAFDAASRALEPAPGCGPERRAGCGAWLDLATDLAEAAAILGDPGRAATVTRALARTALPSVVIGRGWVCKGSTARYRGLLAAALGRWDEADREYRAATELQRRLEAGPLLARTLHEWGRALQGRNDVRSRSYLQEGAELGRRLALADFAARSEERAS